MTQDLKKIWFTILAIMQPIFELFLGESDKTFKKTIIFFLIMNPILLYEIGPYWTTVVMLVQFLYCLFKSTEVYPAVTGGLLVIEGILLKLLSTSMIWHELESSFDVIMLVAFMVAAIYFLKPLMTYLFVNMFIAIENKIALSFTITFAAAILSAFLDALTVTVVIMAVVTEMYDILLNFRAGKSYGASIPDHTDKELRKLIGPQIKDFRKFLSSVIIHALIGTALGGVMTMIGEPQNVLLVKIINEVLAAAGLPLWDFKTFFVKMLPITLPTLIAGLCTTLILEKYKLFGFGVEMTSEEREVLTEWRDQYVSKLTKSSRQSLVIQGIVAFLLVLMLITHFAEVGLIGLLVIILAAAFTGKRDEHDFVPAFEEGGPFLIVLGVLFAFVAMLHQQHTFGPVIEYAAGLDFHSRRTFFFASSGLLSSGSDNVFVAKIFMDAAVEMVSSVQGGINPAGIKHLENLTVAINAGTNIFSVLTPNGQAAFLLFLTSPLAKDRLMLGWKEIFLMTLPYAIVMITVSLLSVMFFL